MRTVVYMNMGNWGSNMILYAGICYNNDSIWVWWCLKSEFSRSCKWLFNTTVAFPIQRIKNEAIRKNIYKFIFWWKFIIKTRKRRNNLIKPMVYIHNWTFDFWSLLRHKPLQWVSVSFSINWEELDLLIL